MNSYYAIFADGSYTPVSSLQDVKILPEFSHILRKTPHFNSNGYANHSSYDFVNTNDELVTIKYGSWEFMKFESPHYTAKDTTYYLFSHVTKTAHKFTETGKLPEFLKEVLFPKFSELAGIQDYEKHLLLKAIEDLRAEVKLLSDRVLIFEGKGK
jgi:hypothetical protein